MRKDQQKWGWKRGGGREDTGVVSLSCNWPGMSSCPLFGQLSFPNDKVLTARQKVSLSVDEQDACVLVEGVRIKKDSISYHALDFKWEGL